MIEVVQSLQDPLIYSSHLLWLREQITHLEHQLREEEKKEILRRFYE